MNDLTSKEGLSIKLTEDNTELDILNYLAAYTPQFYKKSSIQEKQKELNKIKYAIVGIEFEVLKKMCELSLCHYKIALSRDKTTRLNLDYFLSFYLRAFNEVKYFMPSGYYSVIDCNFDVKEQKETTVYQLYDENDKPTEQITSQQILEYDPLEMQRQKLLEKGTNHFKNERSIFELKKLESHRKSDEDWII